MSTVMSELEPVQARGATASSVQFFFAAHLALLLAVLVGFSRSLYLRPLFGTRNLPPVLYLHGAVLTGWFLLMVLQGWLAYTRRVRLHRRTGYVIAAYAALVVAMGLVADLRLGAELTSATDSDGIVFWGNLFSLVLFTIFIALALVFRRTPEAHKRLTLLASIFIVGPALARFSNWPIFPGGMAARPLYGIGGLLVLFIGLIVHDVIVRRRPHRVTVIGTVTFFAILGLAGYLAFSGAGYAILHGQ